MITDTTQRQLAAHVLALYAANKALLSEIEAIASPALLASAATARSRVALARFDQYIAEASRGEVLDARPPSPAELRQEALREVEAEQRRQLAELNAEQEAA